MREKRGHIVGIRIAAPVPAVRLTVIAVQRAVLDKLVADANPLAFYEHLHLAVDDAPRRRPAIVTVAATLAVLAYEIAIDIVGLSRQRGEC